MYSLYFVFCLKIIHAKYESIVDGHRFHLRAKCLSSLTPRVIWQIVTKWNILRVRFVSRDKCLHSISLENKKKFNSNVFSSLSFLFCPFSYVFRSFINSFFVYACASSTVQFASIVHSVTTAFTWLTQRVHIVRWVTKKNGKKRGQLEYKVHIQSGRKEKYLILDITPH